MLRNFDMPPSGGVLENLFLERRQQTHHDQVRQARPQPLGAPVREGQHLPRGERALCCTWPSGGHASKDPHAPPWNPRLGPSGQGSGASFLPDLLLVTSPRSTALPDPRPGCFDGGRDGLGGFPDEPGMKVASASQAPGHHPGLRALQAESTRGWGAQSRGPRRQQERPGRNEGHGAGWNGGHQRGAARPHAQGHGPPSLEELLGSSLTWRAQAESPRVPLAEPGLVSNPGSPSTASKPRKPPQPSTRVTYRDRHLGATTCVSWLSRKEAVAERPNWGSEMWRVDPTCRRQRPQDGRQPTILSQEKK